MGFLNNLFKKDDDPQPLAAQPAAAEDAFAVERAKIDQIYAYLLERYGKPAVAITTQVASDLGLTDSKFGGYPYWEPDTPYPCTSAGQPLVLLAQINLEDVPPCQDLLPATGLLQFFIEDDDDLYGMNFDDSTKQDSFRVVYHPRLGDPLTIEELQDQGVRATIDMDSGVDSFPFFDQRKLTFEPTVDCINLNVANFKTALAAACKDLFNETLEVPPFRYFSDEGFDYFFKKADGWGHKLLGYPNFTQADPRYDAAETSDDFDGPTTDSFDTVLLQIDSEGMDLLWGDSGICNFFINSQNLLDQDFSQVLYQWDCY